MLITNDQYIAQLIRCCSPLKAKICDMYWYRKEIKETLILIIFKTKQIRCLFALYQYGD